MPDLNDLSFFAAVVSNGGFSAAARALGVPKSRISRRVSALETDLGIRLVERSTRRFKVTDVGQDVYRHARAALLEAQAIDEAILRMKAEPQGLVRVSCPAGVDRLIAGCLPQFMAAHPKLKLQFLISNRRVDLIEEGVDLAVRVRERLDTDADLQVKVIERTSLVLVASPGLLAAHGTPLSPNDLGALPTVSFGEVSGAHRWTLTNTAGETHEATHEPRLVASTFPLLGDAVLGGAGVGLLPEYSCRELIKSGRLIRLLPEWEAPQGILHLVFTSRRGLLPGVRAVIDFLASALRSDSPGWEVARTGLL